MKKLKLYVFGLLTLLAMLSMSPSVAAQQGVKSTRFIASGADSGIVLINTAIAWHKLTWNVSGTASACTVALDTSPDGSTWTAGGAITGQTCTSNGSSSVVNVSANYVRMNMTALTVTGGSYVTVTWDGWTSNPVTGSVTGSGASPQVAFWSSPTVLSGSSTFTWADGTNAAGVFQGPSSASLPSPNINQYVGAGLPETQTNRWVTSGASDTSFYGQMLFAESDKNIVFTGSLEVFDATATTSLTNGKFIDSYYSVPTSLTNVHNQGGVTSSLTDYGPGNSTAASNYYSVGVNNTGAGILANAYSLFLNGNLNTGAGSITNSYGAFVSNLSNIGTSSNVAFMAAAQNAGANNWGFYSAPTNKDQFGSIFSGTDNSVAGSLTTSNGSANAHTTWGSAATISNQINGFATVPTTGHIVTCTVSSTTCTLTDGGAPFNPASPGAIGGTTPAAGSFTTLKGTTFNTTTNCSSSASPAVCGSAAAGSAAMPTNVTSSSIQVNTSAVTANSQIFAFTDDTLGTKLGVTCNSTLATLVGGLAVTARVPGTSFTISNNVAVAVNPLCISWLIYN